MMLIRKLPVAIPATAGLTPLDVDDRQIRIARAAGLIGWWRADTLLDLSGLTWGDRVFSRSGAITSGSAAAVSAQSDFNGQPCIVHGPATGTVGDAGIAGVLPVNASYTVVAVAKPGGSGTYAPLWGNGLGTSSGGSYLDFTTTDTIALAHAGTNIITPIAGVSRAKCLTVASFKYSAAASTSVARVRVNRGAASAVNSAVNIQNTDSTFRMGACGTVGTNGRFANLSGVSAEFLLFNVPLLEAGYESILADIEGYLGDRYAIAAAS